MWRSHVPLLLLAWSVAALCFAHEHDVRELGEAGEEGPKELGASGGSATSVAGGSGVESMAQDELMTPWDKQGLKVLDAYAAYNKKLQNNEKALREKLANPPDKMESVKYKRIPGYKYTFLSKKIDDQSRSGCELVCSSYSACKSYSYNSVEKKCIWSMSTVIWETDYTLYEKKGAPGLDPSELYAKLPGMKLQEKIVPLKRGLDKFTGKREPYISLAECKFQCTKKKECKTFSYSDTERDCILSRVPINYDPKWVYFEKDVPIGGAPWKQAHNKENEEKDELKKQWIEGSTAKARAAAEKAAKVEAEILAIKKAEKDAEVKVEEAKKVVNNAIGECGLAKGAWSGTVTDNSILMAKLENQNQELADVTSKKRELNAAIEKAPDFERKEKAKLNAETVDVAEKQKEVGTYTAMEKEEKGRMVAAEKAKISKCGVMDMTKEELATEEGTLKQAEAAAKHVRAQESTTAFANTLKTAENVQHEAASTERRAKADLAVSKSTVDAMKEKVRDAMDERVKKKALDQEAKAEEILEKNDSTEAEDANANRVAHEAKDKAEEASTKAGEREAKAENLVKSRKREAAMKVETVIVNKKLKAKQESEEKSESTNKAQKAQDLIQRKHDEQTEKGKIHLEQLSADEARKKVEIKDDERKYKELGKAKEADQKTQETKTKRLEELTTTEKDAKYKVRKSALTKTVLKENEHDVKGKIRFAEQEVLDTKNKAKTDEGQEKAAAVALKKATTEKDIKKLMRTELNWKSISAKSNEEITKAEQQKMLMQEDNAQAESKVEANECIEICEEGLPLQQKGLLPTGGRRLLGAGNPPAAAVAAGQPAPEPVSPAGIPVAKVEGVELGNAPPVAPFMYKGCQC